MADNETIADIIAEKRTLAAEMEKALGDQHSSVEMLKDDADRLEAALKRERGDCAKLRKALVKCREIALQWQADEAAGVAGTTDKPHARSAAEAVIDMEFELNAALAAPPRNCDRPECATLDMATKTWIQEEFGPLCNNSKATIADIRTFDVWIYAPATGKEGGSDAD